MSYADLMTLLFATFVVLYGIKPEGETLTMLGVASSIREAFMEVPDSINEPQKGPLPNGKAVFKFWKGKKIPKKKIETSNKNIFNINILNRDFDLIKQSIATLESGKIDQHQKNIGKSISLLKNKTSITVRLTSSGFYKPGKYRLTLSSYKKLKPLIEVLSSLNRHIIITGHTDHIIPRSGFSNLELSSLRASYIARYFLDYQNFAPDKVKIAGFGASDPAFSNETIEGRKKNRRVDIKIDYKP